VGFRFIADGDGHAEGAYVDEMRIWGVVLPLRCTANMSASSGYEVVTPFNFSGGAGDGLAPFNWTWSFGDGTTSALQNPTHPFREAGIFTVSVTVRDAVSQSCSVQVGAITVFHDTTSVSVSPRTASFLEGESIALYGADGQGHPFDLNWTVDPANCGSFNVTTGPLATFASATSAGGSTCTVAGSVGDVRAFATFTVAYDTSVMIVDPPSADVPEGKTLNISVTDRYANLLSVLWSTTCGRVAPGSGTFTVFSATTNGGVSCTVTATFGTDRISTVISVIHDTSAIKVTPSAAAMVEGTSQIFSVVDIYTHPFDATWSVDPPSCGSFSSTTGPSVTFSADIAAGEAMCSIVVSSELSSKTVNVTVSHDTRTLSVSPRSATLIEGASQEFRVLDANGHAVAVNWTVSPSACGVLSHASGVGTTLQTSMTAASLSCNVVGRYGATSVLAGVNVVHGPPATITGVPSTSSPEAGTAITLSASAQDAAGHPLTGVTFTWSTPCGSLSGTTGSDVSIALPESAGGTSCTVTVVSGNATGTVTLNIGFAGPFTVTVTPSTLAPSGPQTLTASVKDPQGRALPDAPIVWTATCGVLSSSTGSTTTYTPPADASGGPCTVTAAVAGTDGSSQTTVAVVSAPSMILPIVGIAVVAAGGAAGFLLWRKKKGGAEATEVAAEPMIAEEIQQEPPQ
jgi:PKD repeat protein